MKLDGGSCLEAKIIICVRTFEMLEPPDCGSFIVLSFDFISICFSRTFRLLRVKFISYDNLLMEKRVRPFVLDSMFRWSTHFEHIVKNAHHLPALVISFTGHFFLSIFKLIIRRPFDESCCKYGKKVKFLSFTKFMCGFLFALEKTH